MARRLAPSRRGVVIAAARDWRSRRRTGRRARVQAARHRRRASRARRRGRQTARRSPTWRRSTGSCRCSREARDRCPIRSRGSRFDCQQPVLVAGRSADLLPFAGAGSGKACGRSAPAGGQPELVLQNATARGDLARRQDAGVLPRGERRSDSIRVRGVDLVCVARPVPIQAVRRASAGQADLRGQRHPILAGWHQAARLAVGMAERDDRQRSQAGVLGAAVAEREAVSGAAVARPRRARSPLRSTGFPTAGASSSRCGTR